MNLSRTRLPIVLAAVAAAAVALAGCSSSPSAASSGHSTSEKKMTTVSFLADFVANGVQAPLYYGIDKGYYQDEGIDLKVTAGTGSGNTITAVAAGQADIGDALSASLAQAADKGTTLTSVGWFRANSAFAFFCDKKLDITSVAQLKGHSIISSPGSAQALILPGVLAAGGLSATDVKIDDVSSASAASTYAGGTADCDSQTLGDAPTFITKRPSTTFSWSDAGFAVPGFSFFVTPTYLSSHKSVVAAFLRATYKSIEAAEQNPKAAVDSFEKANPTVDPTLAAAQFKASEVVYCTSAEAKAGSPMGAMSDKEWSSLVSLVQKYAGVSSSLKPSSLYTDEFFKGSNSVSTKACNPKFSS